MKKLTLLSTKSRLKTKKKLKSLEYKFNQYNKNPKKSEKNTLTKTFTDIWSDKLTNIWKILMLSKRSKNLCLKNTTLLKMVSLAMLIKTLKILPVWECSVNTGTMTPTYPTPILLTILRNYFVNSQNGSWKKKLSDISWMEEWKISKTISNIKKLCFTMLTDLIFITVTQKKK